MQQTLRTFFHTFRRTGSGTATVRAFRKQALQFPRRARSGPAKGEILWGELDHSRALWVLHNPRFAGAYFFGRTPMALEATLTVQQQLQARADEAERLRSHQVERARYEADLARRRFMKVDPENRLVADELEAEWNRKLRALTEAQDEVKRKNTPAILDESQRARILALATDRRARSITKKTIVRTSPRR